MEPLITPAQVAEAAFRAPDFIPADGVPVETILAAQQKFILPVLGGPLCGALSRGERPELLAEYIRPPLALYVKAMMLPRLAVQSGAAGVVEAGSKNLSRAADVKMRAAVRALRTEARALMRRAVDVIEASPADYPEYDAARNVLNRCSIAGGIVLPKKTEA